MAPQPGGRRLSSVASLMKVISMELRLFSDVILCVEPGACRCRLSVRLHGDVAVVSSKHVLVRTTKCLLGRETTSVQLPQNHTRCQGYVLLQAGITVLK